MHADQGRAKRSTRCSVFANGTTGHHKRKSQEKATTQAHHETGVDHLIIGAGTKGCNPAAYGEKGHNCRILEAAPTAGAFFNRFPRHRKLISINKVYTGFQDNIVPIPSVVYLSSYASRNQLQIELGVKVQPVEKENQGCVVHTECRNTYAGKWLKVTTGLFEPDTPRFPANLCYNGSFLNPL